MKVEVNNGIKYPQIDWSICPQILEYNGEQPFQVVYIGEGNSNDNFEGVVLTTTKDWSLFESDKDFSKRLFKPFNGTIKLQND
jgi:hypothetical protein